MNSVAHCSIFQGTKLLKEKCVLNLKIERNLDGDRSHAVPDFRIEGSLSSVYCCLDIAQYKLIRGLLDHNLGEKFEPFKKELITSMQDPKIQVTILVVFYVCRSIDRDHRVFDLSVCPFDCPQKLLHWP